MPNEQLTMAAEKSLADHNRPESKPCLGITDLHIRLEAVINYCRDHEGKDCEEVLRLMGEEA
jgi:hypothetical protein